MDSDVFAPCIASSSENANMIICRIQRWADNISRIFYYNMKSLSVLLSTYGSVIFDWLKVEFYIKYPHDKKLSFMVYQFVLRTESI